MPPVPIPPPFVDCELSGTPLDVLVLLLPGGARDGEGGECGGGEMMEGGGGEIRIAGGGGDLGGVFEDGGDDGGE